MDKSMLLHFKNLFRKRKIVGDKNAIPEMWQEIFEEKLYDFNSPTETPNILDVGANIGIATLYFKSKHPRAKIKAFEPVGESFEALKENTKSLESVELFNYGLSDYEGEGVIYGESDTAEKSMTENFIKSKKFTEEQLKPIPCIFKKLSSFVTEPIDFLKIDIEGSEGKVFKELHESGKLKMIKELVMEYHYNLVNKENELGELISRLHKNNFHLTFSVNSNKEIYPIFIRGKLLNDKK